MTIDCTRLDVQVGFEAYIKIIRDVTSADLDTPSMEPCRSVICSTLYGDGNPDITGIGVLIGYCLEVALAIMLPAWIFLCDFKSWKALRGTVFDLFHIFLDAAFGLTFAIQFASAVMLIRKEYGFGTGDFGAITVDAVWLVSILTMVPMTHLCSAAAGQRREALKMIMTCIIYVAFIIIFICRMTIVYSSGQVGTAVITEAEFDRIQNMCFEGAKYLSHTESIVIDSFSLGASLWVSLVVIGNLAIKILHRNEATLLSRIQGLCRRRGLSRSTGDAVILFGIVLWTIPLLWALMRVRSLQNSFAVSLGQQSGNDNWGFGQIMAIIVFFPVLAEILYKATGEDETRCGTSLLGEDSSLVPSRSMAAQGGGTTEYRSGKTTSFELLSNEGGLAD